MVRLSWGVSAFCVWRRCRAPAIVRARRLHRLGAKPGGLSQGRYADELYDAVGCVARETVEFDSRLSNGEILYRVCGNERRGDVEAAKNATIRKNR